MASRAIGALLALVAAMLFLVSLLSPVVTTSVPAWFDGHPIVDGKERVIQDVHVGPFGAAGCNEHGCSTIDGVSTPFRIIGFAEGAVVGLGALFALLLALAAWRLSDRRKTVAVGALVVAICCAGGAVALIVQGPEIKASQHVEIPIGVGFFLFGGAVIAIGVASAVTLAARPQPLRLRTSAKLPPYTAPAPDVRQIVRDQHDSLRPAARGPEPRLGAHNPSESPVSQPLFEAAPQLRPLYEAQGTGTPPVPHVMLPTRAPTPIPRASVGQIAGLPTPLPYAKTDLADPVTPKSPALPFAKTDLADSRAARSPTLPPAPVRATTPSSAPRAGSSAPRSNPPTTPPDSFREKSPAIPRSNPPTTPPDSFREKSPSIPPSNPPMTSPADSFRSKSPANPPATPPDSFRSKAPSMPASSSPIRSVPPTNPPHRTPAPSTPPSNPAVDVAKLSAEPLRKKATVPPPERSSRPKGETNSPAIPSKRPTISTSVPPPPDLHPSPLDRPDTETGGAEQAPLKGPVTAVEIDAAGKAAAKAAEAKRRDVQAARVAAEEEARRRSADAARIAEARRREAEERVAQDEAAAKKRAARLLTGDGNDTDTNAEIGEHKAAIQLTTAERPAVNEDELDAANDRVQLAMRRAPSATPVEPMPVGGVRPITDGPVIEQPPPVAPRVRPPVSTAPSSLPPPKDQPAASSGPTPACPQCEAPMAWVEEHLRFYCKHCRMYF
ncbi:MAG: hypothetical protein JWO36_6494 [Myxococcales bacterium]|nr:hypothetical protein [Myxococcales bacterium]